MDRRVTAQSVIREVARNMEEGLEPLEYSVLAPDHFDVYLEAEDHRQLEPLFDEIGRQVRRKLDERLQALNEAAARPPRVRLPWRAESAPTRYERKGRAWVISFLVDHEPDAEPGRITVHSYFTADADTGGPASVAGVRTRRIAGAAGGRPTGGVGAATRIAPADVFDGEAPHARLQYSDDTGAHVYAMTKDAIVIGRDDPDGHGYWADLRLHTRSDVSREHARLRRDPATGTFAIKDLSRFGTTVDGVPVPPSLHEVDGEPRDRDEWTTLPSRAAIGLAGVLTLHFEAL